jgi:glycosyltransferase involved in cell wall biosynthesis
MRKASRSADCVIVTIPPEKIDWLPSSCRAAFIPVGANIPPSSAISVSNERGVKTIGIFGVTGGNRIANEARDIALAVRHAMPMAANLHVLLFGRHSLDAEPILRQELRGHRVSVEALGLLKPEEVTAAFSRVEVVLFVRGGISARRGSAIAAIACGLPIVAYESDETSFPVTEAGVLLAPQGDVLALAQKLGRVLSDSAYRLQLCERSRLAQQKYFSWTVIAESFLYMLADEHK